MSSLVRFHHHLTPQSLSSEPNLDLIGSGVENFDIVFENIAQEDAKPEGKFLTVKDELLDEKMLSIDSDSIVLNEVGTSIHPCHINSLSSENTILIEPVSVKSIKDGIKNDFFNEVPINFALSSQANTVESIHTNLCDSQNVYYESHEALVNVLNKHIERQQLSRDISQPLIKNNQFLNYDNNIHSCEMNENKTLNHLSQIDENNQLISVFINSSRKWTYENTDHDNSLVNDLSSHLLANQHEIISEENKIQGLNMDFQEVSLKFLNVSQKQTFDCNEKEIAKKITDENEFTLDGNGIVKEIANSDLSNVSTVFKQDKVFDKVPVHVQKKINNEKITNVNHSIVKNNEQVGILHAKNNHMFINHAQLDLIFEQHMLHSKQPVTHQIDAVELQLNHLSSDFFSESDFSPHPMQFESPIISQQESFADIKSAPVVIDNYAMPMANIPSDIQITNNKTVNSVLNLQPALVEYFDYLQANKPGMVTIKLEMDDQTIIPLNLKLTVSGKLQVNFGSEAVHYQSSLIDGWKHLSTEINARGWVLDGPHFEGVAFNANENQTHNTAEVRKKALNTALPEVRTAVHNSPLNRKMGDKPRARFKLTSFMDNFNTQTSIA